MDISVDYYADYAGDFSPPGRGEVSRYPSRNVTVDYSDSKVTLKLL
jgi:hypothetical protein